MSRMHRRAAIRLLLAAVALAAGARPTVAALTPGVDEIEAYLDGIVTARSRFQQIGPDGGLAEGTLYLARPGKMRLDYDPPSQILLVAPGDWRLIYYDASIQQVNVIPIAQTPLSVLLDREVRIGSEIELLDLKEDGPQIMVSLARKGEADQGRVTLVFDKRPMALRGWSVVDPQGLTTHVILENLEVGVALDPSLFHWRDPKIFGLPPAD